MSNFLTHLIARASQKAPILERRQPALFEPVAAWTPPPQPGWPDPAPTEAAPGGPSIIDVPSQAADPVSARGAQDAAHAAESRQSQPPAQPTSSPPAATRRIAMVPLAGEEVHSQNAASISPAREPGSERPAVPGRTQDARLAPPGAMPPRNLRSVPADLSAAPRRDRLPVSDDAPRRRKDAVEADSAAAVSATRGAQQRSETATGVLLPAAPRITQAIQLARTVQPRGAIAATVAARAEKDSVQITIGRVEVRAEPAAARSAARVAKPAAPQLTLDDYLRQRSGGRR